MNEISDLDLRPDGLRFWELVQEGPVLVCAAPLSYSYRLVQPFVIGAAILVVAHLLTRNTTVIVGCWSIVILAFGVFVWWYWTRDRPFGALIAQISDEAIQIGCERDAICIPWSAIDITATELPVNDRFMALPIDRTAVETVLLRTDEEAHPWDRTPYRRRAYLTICYNSEMSWIEVAATPNGFFIDILTVVYPMLGIWRERQGAEAKGPGPDNEQ